MLGFSINTMSPTLRGFRQDIQTIERMEVNTGDPFFKEIVGFVNSVVGTRNVELRMYEDFYEGGTRQKVYIRKFEKETDEEYYKRLDKSIVANKCRRTVRKGAQMLYSNPPERRMEADDAHERMMRIWRFNDVLNGYFHTNVATAGGIYGYQVIRNMYVRSDNKQPVYARTGISDSNEVWYIPTHPLLTIPIPRADKQDEMGAIILLTMENQVDPMFPQTASPRIVDIQFIDDNKWLRWAVRFDNNGREVHGDPVDVKFGNLTNENPYGNVNIPFTLYRNPGDTAFVLDGTSDLADLVEPQMSYNETLSDDGHAIAGNAFPILMLTGLEVKKDFKRSPGQVMATKNPDADGKFITWDSDMAASAKYEDRLEEIMREASGYSPVSDGRLDGIGQVRNVRGAMVPAILTSEEKQVYYGKAEKAHADATLRMLDWHEDTVYENKTLDINYSDAFIPVDELSRVEAESLAINSGVENIRDIIKGRHPELETEEELDAKVAETMELLTLLKGATSNDRPETRSEVDRELEQ